MRHLKSFKQLSRTHSHRRALYRNMVEALLKHERIRTTETKAKEIRRVVEKLITRAKVKNLHNIRTINKLIKDKALLVKLFDEVAPRYVERAGGYTRVIKLNKRAGDAADMAILELVEEEAPKKKKKTKKKKEAIKEEPVTEKKEEAKKEEPKTEEAVEETTEEK